MTTPGTRCVLSTSLHVASSLYAMCIRRTIRSSIYRRKVDSNAASLHSSVDISCHYYTSGLQPTSFASTYSHAVHHAPDARNSQAFSFVLITTTVTRRGARSLHWPASVVRSVKHPAAGMHYARSPQVTSSHSSRLLGVAPTPTRSHSSNQL